jgi:L-ascorbate metabolism protein UlaG (beta-lactamase superfamily)
MEGTRFLVDPMLGAPGDIPPIPDTPNQQENPLVPLPDVELEYDAVVVTHRHRDHFDDAATETLPSDVPLFCNPVEAEAFVEDGFTDVRPVEETATFEGVTLRRTPARHGHGELAEQMAPVCGFVLEGERSLYLAGDTVWYDEFADTLGRADADAVVLNAGAARFNEGEPITMDATGVRSVRDATDGTVIAVHMDAINHCLLKRSDLAAATDGVLIPDDGERIDLS